MDFTVILQPLLEHFWFLITLFLLVAVLKSARFKGWVSEAIVNLSDYFLLNCKTCHLIRNVTPPTEGGTTKTDHLIVYPYGVFLVEAKNLEGGCEVWHQCWTKRFPNFLYRCRMNFENLSDVELFKIYCELRSELADRKISSDVGSIGEQRVLDFFREHNSLPNLTEAAIGTKNVDALSRDGDRYSIKTVIKSRKTSTVYPGLTSDSLFEYMLIAKLDGNFLLNELYRLSWSDFLERRAWDKRMSAWYVPINKRRLCRVERLI